MQLGGLVFLMDFLPVFLILEAVVPEKRKTLLLMAANIVFYALAGWRLLALLFGVSLFAFLAGKSLEKHRDQARFYYVPVWTLVGLFIWKGHMAGLGLLPAAAFFILESLGYLGDIYSGTREAEKNYGNFFFFLSYFPVSQGGPVRPYKRIDFSETAVSAEDKKRGIKRFIEGLAMQSILGNVMQDMARRILYDGVFRGAHLDLAFVWMGAFACGFYVYFTFYGACRMASGLSKYLGMALEKNFDHPLLCVSIEGFMKRFNGSVTRVWMNALINPAKSHVTEKREKVLYGAAFLLTGNLLGFHMMSFCWGAYMFLLWYLETRVSKGVVKQIPKAIRGIAVAALVAVGWIVLLSPDMGKALVYIGQMVGIGTKGLWSPECVFLLVNRWYIWLFAFLSATPALTFLKNRQTFIKKDGGIEDAVYICLLLLSVSYMFSGNGVQNLAGLL